VAIAASKNTRRAYYKAACRFSEWCEGKGLGELASVKPLHVAAYIEELCQFAHYSRT
jgi:site-specific recombinase XerD